MSEKPFRPDGGRTHVVIIGSGFGGLFAAQKFNNTDVDVTIIDRTNHHLFQPLLYQVATGLLSTGEIAPSTRQIFKDQENVHVVKGEVTDINVEQQIVTTELGAIVRRYEYDYLIVAAGAGQSYFGNDHFAEFAPGMKTIDDALEIRARIIGAFERAELATDKEHRERLLTLSSSVPGQLVWNSQDRSPRWHTVRSAMNTPTSTPTQRKSCFSTARPKYFHRSVNVSGVTHSVSWKNSVSPSS